MLISELATTESCSQQTPSRFLTEIPDELIETLGTARSHSRHNEGAVRSGREGSRFDYSYAQQDAAESGAVAVGTAVRHPIFGRGTVLAVVGSDLNQKLRIKFERAGVKTVMVRYANLELA